MRKKIFYLFILWSGVAEILVAKIPSQTDTPHWRDQKSQRLTQSILNLARQSGKTQTIDQSNYDVSFYNLNFSFDLNKNILYGITEIEFSITQDQVDTIYLDLVDNMEIESIVGTIDYYHHQNDLIKIGLDRKYQTGEKAKLRISYNGQPQSNGFGAFEFTNNSTGGRLIWSLSEHLYSRVWWPCKDHPTDKADSVDITITVPIGLVAVSNGLLVKTTTGNGNVTFYWQERYPIAPYLVSLAISTYKYQEKTWIYQDHSMPSVCYYFPDYSDQSITQVINTHNSGMTVFSDLFGIYPFIKEKYGSAQFNWGGGMEHQTITSLGGYDTDLIIHELAHQWWGDYITCASWHDIWLNEGFASICEALYREQIEGEKAYHSYVKSNFTVGLDNMVYVIDTTNVSSVFHRTVYDKGAMVLHMLRYVTGDSTFFQILKTYYQQLPYGIATTTDFKIICENISGQELTWFFDQWIYSAGRPAYKVAWGVDPLDNGYQLKINLSQTQPGITFKMPVQFILKYSATSDTLIQFFNDSKNQDFSVILPQKPYTLGLDPQNWCLKKSIQYTVSSEETEQPQSFTGMKELITYPNPFNEALQIRFSLSQVEPIQISFYNLLGIKVDEIPWQTLSIGHHALCWNPSRLAGGTYLYEIRMPHQVKKGKVLLLR